MFVVKTARSCYHISGLMILLISSLFILISLLQIDKIFSLFKLYINIKVHEVNKIHVESNYL